MKVCASCQQECSLAYMRRCITCEKDFNQWVRQMLCTRLVITIDATYLPYIVQNVSVCATCASDQHSGHNMSKALTKQQRLEEAKVDANRFKEKITIGREEFHRRWSRIKALQQKWLAVWHSIDLPRSIIDTGPHKLS